jgi:hypothetical protein
MKTASGIRARVPIEGTSQATQLYISRSSPNCKKSKNPNVFAVKREAEEDWDDLNEQAFESTMLAHPLA